MAKIELENKSTADRSPAGPEEVIYIVPKLFLLLLLVGVLAAGGANAQCAAGLIVNCPAAVNPQPTDLIYLYQLGVNPHSRKIQLNQVGGGGSTLTLTDGTHTVAGTTMITVTGATVGGTTPNATLTITGGGGLPPGGSVGQPLVNTGSGTGNWLNDVVASATNDLTLTGGSNRGGVVVTGGLDTGSGGGAVIIHGADANNDVGDAATAGSVTISGGEGFAGSSGGGGAGSVTITAGDSAGAGVGNVTISAGMGSGSTHGGFIAINGGIGASGEPAGAVDITAGADAGGGSGAVNIFGGYTSTDGVPGGDVNIIGGSASQSDTGNSNGGNVIISGGTPNGSGVIGLVEIQSLITIITGTPASSSDACTTGQVEWDSGFVYVCIASATWKRSAITTW